MELPTAEEIGHALAVLGNWRVIHVQEVLYPYTKIPASALLGIGFRETGLQNICGGATWDGTKWVAAKTDRGWLQISDELVENREWLNTVPGCREGSWVPDVSGTGVPAPTALAPGHCPRYSDALSYVHRMLLDDMATAIDNEIPPNEALRFAIAAHNAGTTGALEGYRAGNVDAHTAHGNYSAYVLALQPAIHNWIVAHPNWQYKFNPSAHLSA